MLPKTCHARYVYNGFQKLMNRELNIIFYAPKWEKVTDIPSVKSVWSSRLYPFQILNEVLKDRPNIVHVQQEFNTFGPFYTTLLLPLLLLLLKIIDVKTVVTVHAVVPFYSIDNHFVETFMPQKRLIPPSLVKILLLLIYKTISVLTPAIIVHNHCLRSYLANHYGADKEKIHVIYTGVEENVVPLDRNLIRRWAKKLSGKRPILYFGYIVPRKGLEFLIEAYSRIARRFPSYVLVMAGGSLPHYRGYVHKIEDLIKESGMAQSTMLTGFISEDEIHVLYELAEFVVLPYTYSISASAPLYFVMQHAKPIIATRIGVFDEEIKDGEDGILVPPRSATALEKAMEKLIENEELRRRLSERMRAKFSGRSWQSNALQKHTVYKSLIGKGHN